MTVFMVGLGASQLFYGPLSDRFGRKPVLLFGLLIFMVASVVIVFADSFAMLLWGRFFQAVGTCSTIVSAMAIARDIYPADKIVKIISMIMAIIGFCAVIAPFWGSFLQSLLGWQGPFIFLLVLGIGYFVIITFMFKESQKSRNYHALKPVQLYGNYRLLLRVNAYCAYIITSACSYGALFAYAAASSIIIVGQFHYSVIAYGALFSINSVAIVLMSILAPKLNKYLSIDRLVLIGALLLSTGSAITLIVNLVLNASIWSLVLPMWVATLGVAMIRPTASSGAMSTAPVEISGSAAALFNFMSFIGGALSTFVIACLQVNPVNFSLFILLLGMMACLVIIYTFGFKLSADKELQQ